MADERVFQVEAGQAVAAVPIDLTEAGFRERSDLQEWVLKHPEIIGDDVMIITSEFDYWESFDGTRQLNRLDVLGIDSDGRLVLAELKRDRAPDNIQLQAINYAALVASFTEDDVVDAFRRHMASKGTELSEDEATKRILEHCDLDAETLHSPRIVLIAGEFSAVTTAAVDWLTEQGLTITLQRVQAYRIPSGATVMSVSQLYPLPTVDELRVTPRRAKQETRRERQSGRREGTTVSRLVRSGAIEDGTPLTLEPTNEITPEYREVVGNYITVNPEQRRAIWRNSRSAPLEWEADGQSYAPTTIVKRVVEDATGITDRAFHGPRWWRVPDGRMLTEVARSSESAQFDWSPLHEVLKELPAGRWTTYGDLATMVGTAAQPLGQHLAGCNDCVNAWRVLDSQGRSRPQFAWSDPSRTETQIVALEKEGVRFDSAGKAEVTQRLSAEELGDLVETADENLDQ